MDHDAGWYVAVVMAGEFITLHSLAVVCGSWAALTMMQSPKWWWAARYGKSKDAISGKTTSANSWRQHRLSDDPTVTTQTTMALSISPHSTSERPFHPTCTERVDIVDLREPFFYPPPAFCQSG